MESLKKEKFRVSLNMDYIPDTKRLVFEFVDIERDITHRFDIRINKESIDNQIEFLQDVRKKYY